MSKLTQEELDRIKTESLRVYCNGVCHSIRDAHALKINDYSLAELIDAAEFQGETSYTLQTIVTLAHKYGIALSDESDLVSSRKEFCEAIEKRIMPPGMEWPRFEDGEPVTGGDIIDQNEYCEADANFVVLALDGSCYELLSDYDGELHEAGERIKRPEPKQDTLQNVIRSIIYELSIKDHCEDDAGFLWEIIELLKALEERMGVEE